MVTASARVELEQGGSVGLEAARTHGRAVAPIALPVSTVPLRGFLILCLVVAATFCFGFTQVSGPSVASAGSPLASANVPTANVPTASVTAGAAVLSMSTETLATPATVTVTVAEPDPRCEAPDGPRPVAFEVVTPHPVGENPGRIDSLDSAVGVRDGLSAVAIPTVEHSAPSPQDLGISRT